MEFGTGRWLSCVRGLWESLCLATEPDLAIIMVQAPPVPDEVIGYLLEVAAIAHYPGSKANILPNLAHRHTLVNIDDHRDVHLSEKLLHQPVIVDQIRRVIAEARSRGQVVQGLSSYASSDRVFELAVSLGTDLLETPPGTLIWGTKAGSRQVFREAGVRHPIGTYEAQGSPDGLADRVVRLSRESGRGLWIVKLDSGFGSGHGNAILDVAKLAVGPGRAALADCLVPCSPEVSRAQFAAQLVEVGAIAEEYIRPAPGRQIRYPSALGYIAHGRDGSMYCQVLGTHEQMIGPHQDFVGCSFPALQAYRPRLLADSRRLLTTLAALGVRGHVGIDFIASSSMDGPDGWAIAATEINLRQTGSTHPHRTVRALVTGRWLPDGRLLGQDGREVVYTATDGLISDRYRGISAERLVAALRADRDLTFDPVATRGVVPHLWTSLEPFGKIGATIIGRSLDECAVAEHRFSSLLDRLAGR
jgi:hypothetical protein